MTLAITRLLLFIAALLMLAVPVPAVCATGPEVPAQQPTPAIATKADASEDADISTRIRSIFGQIEALRDVRVQVSAGVVTLSGTVPAADDKGRAEAIASRVAGVVTVQNEVTRNLDVGTKVAPAIGQFGDEMRGFVRALPLFGVAVGTGILIVLVGYGIASRTRLLRWIAPNVFLAELLATSIRIVFIIFGLVIVLEVLGATALLGGVLGGAGVVGIALGFAVRDTVTNYVASIMLSLRQPFRANDHVVIEGHEGRVVRLTSRATILLTLDGNHVQIPNATVFNAVILNYSRNPQRRFEFDLGIDANDNPVDGMDVGLAAMNALAFVLDKPKATAVIRDVGDSNVVLRFYGWVDQTRTDFLKGRSLAIQAAKTALEGSGFALPEPIYRLRFDEGASLPVQSLQPGPARQEAKARHCVGCRVRHHARQPRGDPGEGGARHGPAERPAERPPSRGVAKGRVARSCARQQRGEVRTRPARWPPGSRASAVPHRPGRARGRTRPRSAAAPAGYQLRFADHTPWRPPRPESPCTAIVLGDDCH